VINVDEKKFADRIVGLERAAKEHAAGAAHHLVAGDYSLAATEAHRAYQKSLQAQELKNMLAVASDG